MQKEDEGICIVHRSSQTVPDLSIECWQKRGRQHVTFEAIMTDLSEESVYLRSPGGSCDSKGNSQAISNLDCMVGFPLFFPEQGMFKFVAMSATSSLKAGFTMQNFKIGM